MKNGIKTIGEIVASDFRTAQVFREAGIDFCCGGKMSLDEACREKGIEPAVLLDKIEEIAATEIPGTMNYKEWDPGFLCDYIVNTHHRYVKNNMQAIVEYTGKIASVHGHNHPELLEVASLFSSISTELKQHLGKEEEVLFPAIKSLSGKSGGDAVPIIRSEIARMSGEHEIAGKAMDRINILTSGYMVPADGCNTYRAAFSNLDRFEQDLHIHVHLENNILFPAALELANNYK
ncbi:MAG: iron-sulfur cluster repair di-iron protein [Bacteroidales bacterium]